MEEKATVETNDQQLTEDASNSFKVFDEDNDDEGYEIMDNRFESRFRGGIYYEQDIDNSVYYDLEKQTHDDGGWYEDYGYYPIPFEKTRIVKE